MDDIDFAQEKQEKIHEDRIERARLRATEMPKGEPGGCDYCGEYFTRLVNGACGRCRDEFKLD